jgi:hypothetical protein
MKLEPLISHTGILMTFCLSIIDCVETPTHMSIKINRLEEGHNSYPLVCRRPAETVPLQRRQICYPELEIKETTDTASSASFLNLYLEFDDSGQLGTKIYDKRDDFNFKIINFLK